MKWFMIACLLCTPVYAAPPDSVQASYEISKNGLPGKIDETYTRNGDHYTLSSTTVALGGLFKISVASRGLINHLGLRPQHFEYKFNGRPDKDRVAEFDWVAQQLTLANPAQHPPIALQEGTQDRLSAMYQFMFINFKDRSVLNFTMTDGNKLDNYHYAIVSRQKLDTPAGQFDSIYLDSQAKPGESRTEIWLSSEYNLPCQMIITDANGDQYTQKLSSLKILP
ncbi:MAG: DUF3108 domain-containing protein [Proteobacteria bacterium]|nr:DUF3108 domain-containing protein [Pseudomonadota bacterium]